MSKNSKTPCIKPLSAAIGAAFVTSLAISPAMASDNPFGMTELDSGYMVAGNPGAEGKCGEGKCGEGKCGEGMHAEGMCGEGMCGAGFHTMEADSNGDGMISQEEHEAYAASKFASLDTDGDGMVSDTEAQAAMAAHHEGAEAKCGEGKCGEGKGMEGACGEKSSEGSCGGRA